MEPIVIAHVATWLAGGIIALLVRLLFTRYSEVLADNAKRDTKRDELEKEFRAHLATLPLVYVAKADYHRDLDEIKDILKDIRNELKERNGSR